VYEEFGRVVGLGLIGTLVLAGCSLAVAVTTSVLERRRQFALLRSAGMPVSRLRVLVLLQAGAPLVTVAAFSALLGIAVAQVILRVASTAEVPLPGSSLALTLGASLLGALVVVALMLPPLERLTRPESARAE
jgi:ABC-type antimicrobial peptide transport system permease subunit